VSRSRPKQDRLDCAEEQSLHRCYAHEAGARTEAMSAGGGGPDQSSGRRLEERHTDETGVEGVASKSGGARITTPEAADELR